MPYEGGWEGKKSGGGVVSAGEDKEEQSCARCQQTWWLHLPTGPKSSVAYGIKSDHKQKHTNKQQKTERGGVKIKTFGVKL